MFEVWMVVSVLAILVVGSVGAAWITSAFNATVERLESRLMIVEDEHEAMKQQIHRTTPESLKVAVDALEGAHAAHRAAVRREFGSLWGRLGGRTMKDALAIDVEPVQNGGGSQSDFDAMIALQSADPSKR